MDTRMFLCLHVKNLQDSTKTQQSRSSYQSDNLIGRVSSYANN